MCHSPEPRMELTAEIPQKQVVSPSALLVYLHEADTLSARTHDGVDVCRCRDAEECTLDADEQITTRSCDRVRSQGELWESRPWVVQRIYVWRDVQQTHTQLVLSKSWVTG